MTASIKLFLYLSIAALLVEVVQNFSLNELILNGTRLEWTYHRNGVTYYMTPDMTADILDSARQRFNVSYHPSTPSRVTKPPTTVAYDEIKEEIISQEQNTEEYTTEEATPVTTTKSPLFVNSFKTGPNEFVTIYEEGRLMITEYQDEFTLVEVEGTESSFNLFFENVPIVTSRTRPPFDFFLQTNYPAEPPAVFSLEPYKFHLNSSYRGERANIIPTLEEIALLPSQVEKTDAITDLLYQMNANNHIFGGGEIFTVGFYIISELEDPFIPMGPFYDLPLQVQIIARGSYSDPPKVQFNLRLTDGAVAPITEHLGLNTPAPIYPFKLEMDPADPQFFTIKSDKGSYWDLDRSEMIESTSSPGRFRLIFNALDSGNDYFDIYPESSCSADTLTYEAYRNSTRYQIGCRTDFYGPVRFSATEYDVNVDAMYASVNKAEAPEVAFLIQRYGQPSRLQELYSELTGLMRSNGHLPGKEIWTVAQYIKMSLGLGAVYDLLPYLVYFTPWADFELQYVANETREEYYDMKYSWASDLHENIDYYSFKESELSSTNFSEVRFAIIYGSTEGQKMKIYVDPLTHQLRERPLTGELIYDFELVLADNELRFSILWNDTWYISTSDEEPDFYFDAVIGNSSEAALFKYR